MGAALTIAGGLLGAWIQAAREHRKWLREKRLEVDLFAAAFLNEYELRTQTYSLQKPDTVPQAMLLYPEHPGRRIRVGNETVDHRWAD